MISVRTIKLIAIVSCFSPLRNALYAVKFMAAFGALTLQFFLCLILHRWSIFCHQFFLLDHSVSSVSIILPRGFVISRFYQQILLTPTSFLTALSMAGSVTVTCLSTWKLLPPPQLIRSLLTSHGTASKGGFFKWKFSLSFILWLEKNSCFLEQNQNVYEIGCASVTFFSCFSAASILILSFVFAQNSFKLLKPIMVLH